ncbi:hypothetical protein [Caproiciproducens faecalis]|uniref:Uncharacterized protein n=1 Tax=Caproiciproducens faecalis TaxID=2820301 RepID=A0ABS7DPW7_9FIRM|nr:hypothetical protein [Caproiciproducens faecalis]MBW7572855.1 hypothetical protein [Caproiciproducens faecalis]
MPNNDAQKQLLESLLGQLNTEDRKKLQDILADKTATEKILSTPQAQELLKKFTGGK